MKMQAIGWILTSFLVFNLGGCGGSGGDSDAPPVAASAVEQGKQAVGALRTWTTQLNDLSRSGQDFQQELQIADSAGQAAATTSESLLVALVAMANAFVSTDAAPYDLAAYLPAGFFGTATGTIVRVENRFSLTNGTINDDTVTAVVVFPSPGGTEFTLEIISAEVNNAHAYSRVDKGRATAKYATTSTSTRPQSLGSELQVTVGEKDSGLNNQFTGQLIFDATNYTDPMWGQSKTNIGHVLLGGEFKNSRHSFSATFDVNMRNAGVFVGATPLQTGYQHKELATYTFSADGKSITIIAPDSQVTYVHDAATQKVSVTYAWSTYSYTHERYGVYTSLDSFLTTASLYEIQNVRVAGEGYYVVNMPDAWNLKGGSLDGTLAYGTYAPENVKMWRDIDGTLRFDAELNGLPKADIVLAVDRTAYGALAGSVIVAYGNVEIKLEGDGAISNLDFYGGYCCVYAGHGTSPQPNVELSNPKLTVTIKKDGITAKVVIEPDANNDWAGTVTANGTVVGTIKPDPKTRTMLVTYVDGTFETVVF